VPITPDRKPGEADEEGIIFENRLPGDYPTVGGVRYVDGSFSFRDSLGLFDPRSGSGLSEAQHKALKQLIHLADDWGPFEGFTSGAHLEVTPAGPFPTLFTWWTGVAKTHKIVDELVSYNANKTVNQVTFRVYDSDGTTVLATVTDTYAYTGVFESSRTRVIV